MRAENGRMWGGEPKQDEAETALLQSNDMYIFFGSPGLRRARAFPKVSVRCGVGN